jgi:hypothetical protein
MATSAQIRQQLVEALELDLIGPGWVEMARGCERLSQPPSVLYMPGFWCRMCSRKSRKADFGEAAELCGPGQVDDTSDAASLLEMMWQARNNSVAQ